MRASCVTTASTVIETAARADMMRSEVASAAPRSLVGEGATLIRESFARGLFITFSFRLKLPGQRPSITARIITELQITNCRGSGSLDGLLAVRIIVAVRVRHFVDSADSFDLEGGFDFTHCRLL